MATSVYSSEYNVCSDLLLVQQVASPIMGGIVDLSRQTWWVEPRVDVDNRCGMILLVALGSKRGIHGNAAWGSLKHSPKGRNMPQHTCLEDKKDLNERSNRWQPPPTKCWPLEKS